VLEVSKYLQSIKSFVPEITDDEIDAYSSLLSVKNYQKKDIIIKAGQTQHEIGFIANGLIRSYFLDNNGSEITVRFHSENDYAIHYAAFITKQPSKYNFVALEPTSVVNISFENMHKAYNTLPSIQKFGRLIAEEVIKTQQYKIESLLFLTAEERYLEFIKYYPKLYNRISLTHLCSYLGIERQTLTRIRQKISGQKVK
jgi:CRP/FNR family transcriptional regulator, anaerobic regulatory protein